MTVLSVDPHQIPETCKEAVVDSLLNQLSARVSGRSDHYAVIYGNRPSRVLLSEFMVPMSEAERSGDEQADPIRICAHGIDFQLAAGSASQMITVTAHAAAYVRIWPSVEDVAVGGRLPIEVALSPATEADLRRRIRDGLSQLEGELPAKWRDPAWASRSREVSRQAYAAVGVPFNAARDDATNQAPEENAEGESQATSSSSTSTAAEIPDHLAKPIVPPEKWCRLPLELPAFVFSPGTLSLDLAQANAALKAAVEQQLAAWAACEERGQAWGFRDGVVARASDILDWNGFLARARASGSAVALPPILPQWDVAGIADPQDPSRISYHVALENRSEVAPSMSRAVDASLFQVCVEIDVPTSAHRMLHLDRIKASYRYNEYLKYPALGFNSGVVHTINRDRTLLRTTWAPRYVLPRITPTPQPVERGIRNLSQAGGLQGVLPLVAAFDAWLLNISGRDVSADTEDETAAAKERAKFADDLCAWRNELRAIEAGLAILQESQAHWRERGPQCDPRAIPFEAWLAMNEAMAGVAEAKGYTEWRLFQLAFILSSVPTFATRIPAFAHHYTREVEAHADSVTLLYFATGGGKSEAFLGLLAFVLFLDRLRGKEAGVSALMRYPLRLLTLQQARRTFDVMGACESIRAKRCYPGEPFSLGFWVGGSNTPNRHTDEGYNDVPTSTAVPPGQERALCGKRQNPAYLLAKERWLKLARCPFCRNTELALRRFEVGGNTLGHFCTSPAERCDWNGRFSAATPLPFYTVDEDIYAFAPSVLLGTIDKLAALGHAQGTIRKFFGMFGGAVFEDRATGRLQVPGKIAEWDESCGGKDRLFPAFPNGRKKLFDPFPSLLVQDEAHLLDESLGTFSGLFETAFEAGLDELATFLGEQCVRAPGSSVRRRIKVIAASATVSDPTRQMRELYQRASTVQFPHPGPSLYASFYASPRIRAEYQRGAAVDTEISVESRSHWARVYVSLLTNGHRHTVAMASVLAHYHQIITESYEGLRSQDVGRGDHVRAEMIRWISPGVHETRFVQHLASANAATLLTLVDLHRIALTYVTNKKGGDQVIDTEKTESERLHAQIGFPDHRLSSELISGAVSAADIQRVVARAESRVGPGSAFPDLNDTLRSVIATAAISHGVDVEEFNAMFFAGLPSDIAEYIQASSRVGRTHVGFSLLVPVPQRHRDRFVLEIHDIFHRFLERMILPASIDRWAEKALRRVMPSIFQEYVCGVSVIADICRSAEADKPRVNVRAFADEAKRWLASPNHTAGLLEFMSTALGLTSSQAPPGATHYRRLLESEVNHYLQDLQAPVNTTGTNLREFFAYRDHALRPMTSLRDVDLPGVIHESPRDFAAQKVDEGAVAEVMRWIRRGSGADIDSTPDATSSKRKTGASR